MGTLKVNGDIIAPYIRARGGSTENSTGANFKNGSLYLYGAVDSNTRGLYDSIAGSIISVGDSVGFHGTSSNSDKLDGYHASSFLQLSGGTMTGALNFANGTWNLLGDDVYFGDNNISGAFCIKGANGTTNLRMTQYGGTASGSISWDGSAFTFSNYIYGSISNASYADELKTTRTIFGQNFNGSGNVAGRAYFNGYYTSSANERYHCSAIEIRENDLVANSQSDIGYAPAIGFHWGNMCAGTLCYNGIFHFKTQGWDRATIDANLNGWASSAGNASTCNGTQLDWSGSIAWGDTAWIAAWSSDGSKIKALNKDNFAPASHSHNYLPLSGGTMSGDIVFSNSGTAFRSIWGTCGDNDQWRIGGGATGSNSGYMEIATADDGTEPIYVRQYTGVFSSLTRTLTLLDGSGNTSVPGNLNVGGKVELWSDSEGGNIRLTSPNGSWWSIDALNNSSMRFIWAESTVPFSFSNDGTISGTYFTGTAASASNSDTLDGLHAASFMQNGHIGVSNFNSLTTSGVYRFGSAGDYSNPPPNSWGQVLVLHGGGDTINQISCDYSGRNMWMRGGNPSDVGGSGSWYSWGRIWCEGNSVTSAVWNDYAEYRESDCQEFGRVLMEKGDDSLTVTNERLSHFAGISSDTWGFSQGETDKAQTPIAVAGRVLAYPYQDRNNYKPGDCVCAAPNGTVDIMTREEVIQWPDRIVGTVSCVPNYEEWGGGEGADRDPVKVNGRIWIKVK